MAEVIHTIAPRTRLTEAVDRAPDYLRPIYEAVRDHGCGFAIVSQDAGPFQLPDDRPAIIILGDDWDEAKGPSAFDSDSVYALVRATPFAVIVSSAAHLAPYKAAADVAAVKRNNCVLVETRPVFETPWIEFLRRARPNINILLSTPWGEEGLR